MPRSLFEPLHMLKKMELDKHQQYMEGDIIKMDIMIKDMNNDIVDIGLEIDLEHKRTDNPQN